MGGFISSVGSKLEGLAEKGTSSLENSSAGKAFIDTIGAHSWELDLTGEGKAIKSMATKYEAIRSQSLNTQNKSQKAVLDWMSNDNTARSSLDLKSATISDIHSHAVSRNHPIQAETQSILNSHLNPVSGQSNAADLTMQQLSRENLAKAKLDGIAGSFGPKYDNLSPILASMASHPDPRMNMQGQRYLDIISNLLRDTNTDRNDKQFSMVKAGVAKAFNTYNKLTESNLPIPGQRPTYYPPSDAESTWTDLLRTIQLPAIAIPHLAQYTHLAADSPLSEVSAALFSQPTAHAMKMIDASAVTANIEHDIIHSTILARTGKIAKWTGSPTAGEIVNKFIHQPGFNWVRTKQLAFGASVGYHSAQHWAAELMRGSNRAIEELEELELDPHEIQQQGGKLTEDQLKNAIFHYTNNRLFISRGLDQAKFQNRNWFTRSVFMYHNFINSESAYLRRTFLKLMKSGDIKGIAQAAGVIGIAFPYVAPVIKSLEVMARTGSPSRAIQEAQEDYKNLFGSGGPEAFAMTYVEMLSHIGAMGIYFNYINAIKGHTLVNAVVGPQIGVPATHIQDTVNAVRGQTPKPLERDALEDIPVIGRPLAHTLAPTNKEAPKFKRRLSLRRKR